MIEGKFGDLTLCKIDIKELRQASKNLQIKQKPLKTNPSHIEIQQPNFEAINFQQKPIFSYDHIKESDRFFYDEMKMNELATRNDFFLKNYQEKYEQIKLQQEQKQIKQKMSITNSVVSQQQLQQQYLQKQQEIQKNKNFLSSTWTAPQNQPKKRIFEPTPQDINAIVSYFQQRQQKIEPKSAKLYAEAFQTVNPQEIWKNVQ